MKIVKSRSYTDVLAFLPLSGYKTIHIHRHLFIAIILTIKCTEELGVGVDGHKGKRGGAIIAADAEFLCCRLSHPTVAIVFAKTIFIASVGTTQKQQICAYNSYIRSCNSYSHHLGTFESKGLIMTILLYDRVYEQSIPFKRQVSNGLGHITSMLLLTLHHRFTSPFRP